MTHLHLHTHLGSILDGIGKPEEYALLAKQYNHKACAITDHGRVGGILEFQKQMKKQNIKPILGVELYLSDNLYELDSLGKRIRTKNNHLILLAQNEKGYKNLLKLNFLSMQDDHFYYSPRVLWEEVKKYNEGLILGTACIGSKEGRLLLNKENIEENLYLAEQLFKEKSEIFDNRMFAEIQINELDIQKQYNEFIINLASKYNVPICLTGDVHYSKKIDSEIQTLSIMISRKQTISDMDSDKFFDIEAKNLFYQSEQDFNNLNKEFNYNYSEEFINQCLNNTDKIADSINYEIPKRTKMYIPVFEDNETIFQNKIKKALNDKFGNKIPKQYSERIQKEYKVIKEANLIDYFLIVDDYHEYSRKLKDFSCIGRGSAGGSLILYLLGVCALNPLEHDLIFERFLTPQRAKKDYPDIDSDFSKEVKPLIEEYLVNKYTTNRVLHVATYNTLGIKSAAKDLCRIYKIDYTKSNEFTTELNPDISWEENIDYLKSNKPNLYKFYLDNKKTLDITPRLNGLVRNMGVHAGGIVILSDDVNNIIPVDRVSGVVTTAFQESGSIQELDELGVIKFDILGVKTLGSIRRCYDYIFETRETALNMNKEEFWKYLYNIDLTDPNIYKEVNNQNTFNLFQMTGDAYKKITQEIKPSNWEEVNACNAMSRPGTISFKEQYLEGKFKGKSKYPKQLNPIIEKTHYTILYQEQAMEIFNKIGGFTLEEADEVRGIMKKLSKKDKKEEDLEKWKNILNKFKVSAFNLGLTEKQVNDIAEDLIQFSSYSFNKSHCYAYSYIGIVTAFLSYYFRTEFFCASLNNPEEDTSKIMSGIIACKNNGIKILPPNINKSKKEFSVTGENEITFGLIGIKYVGEKAISLIQENRKYTSFRDFLTNPNLRNRNMNIRIITGLISSGCFDEIENSNKRKYFIEFATLFNKNRKKEKEREELEELYDHIEKQLNSLPEIITTDKDIENMEKESLGFNFFANMFNEEIYEKLKEKKINFKRSFNDLQENISYPVLVQVNEIREFNDKNGNEMAFVTLVDENLTEKKIPFFASCWNYVKDLFIEKDVCIIVLYKNNNQVMFGRKSYFDGNYAKKSILKL